VNPRRVAGAASLSRGDLWPARRAGACWWRRPSHAEVPEGHQNGRRTSRTLFRRQVPRPLVEGPGVVPVLIRNGVEGARAGWASTSKPSRVPDPGQHAEFRAPEERLPAECADAGDALRHDLQSASRMAAHSRGSLGSLRRRGLLKVRLLRRPCFVTTVVGGDGALPAIPGLATRRAYITAEQQKEILGGELNAKPFVPYFGKGVPRVRLQLSVSTSRLRRAVAIRRAMQRLAARMVRDGLLSASIPPTFVLLIVMNSGQWDPSHVDDAYFTGGPIGGITLGAPGVLTFHAGEVRCLLPTPLPPVRGTCDRGRLLNAALIASRKGGLEQRKAAFGGSTHCLGAAFPAGSFFAMRDEARLRGGSTRMPRRDPDSSPASAGGHPQFAAEGSFWYVCFTLALGEVMDSSDAVAVAGPPALRTEPLPAAAIISLSSDSVPRRRRPSVAVGRQGIREQRVLAPHDATS